MWYVDDTETNLLLWVRGFNQAIQLDSDTEILSISSTDSDDIIELLDSDDDIIVQNNMTSSVQLTDTDENTTNNTSSEDEDDLFHTYTSYSNYLRDQQQGKIQ